MTQDSAATLAQLCVIYRDVMTKRGADDLGDKTKVTITLGDLRTFVAAAEALALERANAGEAGCDIGNGVILSLQEQVDTLSKQLAEADAALEYRWQVTAGQRGDDEQLEQWAQQAQARHASRAGQKEEERKA